MEADFRACPVSNGITVTLSDTADFSLVDESAEAGQSAARYVRGFHANASGALAVMFPKNDVAVSLSVIEGAFYPYIVRRFMSTGTDIGLVGKIIALR